MKDERLTEILRMYGTGTPLEEVNALLEKEGYGKWKLNPYADMLTSDEILNGTAGLLNHGVPPHEKVIIEDGVIQGWQDCEGGIAEVWISGKWYRVVDGNKVGPEIIR